MNEVTIKVEGMSCGGCVNNVTGVLKALAGVEDAQVSVEAMRAAIEDAGFDAPA